MRASSVADTRPSMPASVAVLNHGASAASVSPLTRSLAKPACAGRQQRRRRLARLEHRARNRRGALDAAVLPLPGELRHVRACVPSNVASSMRSRTAGSVPHARLPPASCSVAVD